MSTEDEVRRYFDACHAMQSGVAAEMGYDPSPTTPKHLRVGVNAAMRDHASLAALLIRKGVITEEEYLKAIADGMEEEVQVYAERISARNPGSTIHLQ